MTTTAPSSDAAGGDGHPWAFRFALLCAAVLAIRIVSLKLNPSDLVVDEAQYWAWSREWAWGYFSKPPLIAWIIGLATSACGNAEACVRLPSPLIHTATSVVLFLAARALYGPKAGFWAGAVFLTLPMVSYSSLAITTDVPLLFFWSVALYAWIRLVQTRSLVWIVTVGVAAGIGLLAKYAMIFFLPAALVHLAVDREARWMLRDPRMLLALALPLAIYAPNLAWNARNGFATYGHTAGDAEVGGALMEPEEALEFLVAQFGLFGPVAMAALLWIAARAPFVKGFPGRNLLLSFSITVVILLTVQGLFVGANANWAETAYPAATILFVGWFLRFGRWRARVLTVAFNAVVVLAAAATPLVADRLPFPRVQRLLSVAYGWSAIGEATRARLAAGDYTVVLTDHRWLSAELAYQLRDVRLPLRAWDLPGPPRDHFEMTRPFTGADGPVLLVRFAAADAAIGDIGAAFDTATLVGTETAQSLGTNERHVQFWALDGFRGYPDVSD